MSVRILNGGVLSKSAVCNVWLQLGANLGRTRRVGLAPRLLPAVVRVHPSHLRWLHDNWTPERARATAARRSRKRRKLSGRKRLREEAGANNGDGDDNGDENPLCLAAEFENLLSRHFLQICKLRLEFGFGSEGEGSGSDAKAMKEGAAAVRRLKARDRERVANKAKQARAKGGGKKAKQRAIEDYGASVSPASALGTKRKVQNDGARARARGALGSSSGGYWGNGCVCVGGRGGGGCRSKRGIPSSSLLISSRLVHVGPPTQPTIASIAIASSGSYIAPLRFAFTHAAGTSGRSGESPGGVAAGKAVELKLMGRSLRLALRFEEGAPRHDAQILIPRNRDWGNSSKRNLSSSNGSGSGSSSSRANLGAGGNNNNNNNNTDGPYRVAEVLGDGRVFLCISISPLNTTEAETTTSS